LTLDKLSDDERSRAPRLAATMSVTPAARDD
jgi:hypothetical protein